MAARGMAPVRGELVPLSAYVNHGRWIADCAHAPASTSAQTLLTQQLRHTGSGSGVTTQPGSLTSRMLIVEYDA